MAMDFDNLADRRAILRRAEEIFEFDLGKIIRRGDGLFAWLLLIQWLATIFASLAVAPNAWTHQPGWASTHLWVAVFVGAIVVAIPVGLGLVRPGEAVTRHAIAVGQMLIGSILIHLTGGRFQTHFHVFVSLALLSFYRDWRVLVSASAVVLLDHCIRGFFWPLSIYGVESAGAWRWVEHVSWIGLIDLFLMRSCALWVQEMRDVALRQSELEAAREQIAASAEFAEALNQGESLSTYASALGCIRRILGLPCSVLYTSTSEGKLEARVAVGMDDGPLDASLLQSEGLPAKVFRTCEPEMILGPFGHASLRIRFGLGDLGLQAVRGWPIVFQKQCLGVLLTAHLNPLTEPQRGFLVSSLDQLAIRMNALRVEEQRVELLADLQRQSVALQEASHKAERASRVKSEFLANMSHELRTPMNSIMGFTQRLIRRIGAQLSERDSDALKTVDRNAKHLLGLINNILDLSKIEAGKMEVKRARFDLKSLVREVVEQTVPLADGKPVAVRCGIEERDSFAYLGDSVMLRQIVTNLISNAIKYTDRGEVLISVEPGFDSILKDVLKIKVSDSGIGIKPEDLCKLFQKFTQLDGASTRRVGGTGLGLVICDQYARLHGGRIDVESEPGCGSLFTLVLPHDAQLIESTEQTRDDESAAPALPRRSAAADAADSAFVSVATSMVSKANGRQSAVATEPALSGAFTSDGRRRVTILCVDDDPDILKYLHLTFEDEGFRVLVAADHDSALEEARARRPDLVCLDLRMPGKDGFEVMKSLRSDERLADVPIVVVSVASEEVRALDAGAQCYLAKPVDAEGLVATVREILSMPGGSVLVVEDNADTARLLEEALLDHGFETRLAANGREGLRMLAEAAPAAIVLDLMMPVMDGYAFLRHVRLDPVWSKIPVVILTAKTLEPDEIVELSRISSAILTKGRADTERVIDAILRSTAEPSLENVGQLMETGV